MMRTSTSTSFTVIETWNFVPYTVIETFHSVPCTVIENNITSTKPERIAHVLNKYFIDILTRTIVPSDFSQLNSLSDININSFFIKPAHKIEIQNVILSLKYF